MKTYAQASKTPKEGWGRTEDHEHLNAAAADILALKLCMRPAAIYNWAQKHNVKLWPRIQELADIKGPLLLAVLNDLSLEEANHVNAIV